MKKKILITAGPTNEYIDEVMKITNMSTGRLGIELTKNYLNEGYNLGNNPNLKTIPIETTEDMLQALINESKNKYDLVIHSSAVGDYKPEFSFRMEDLADELAQAITQGLITKEEILSILTNPKCKVNDNTKISSYEPHLTVKLTLTPKLISRLRKLFPEATLIGFKLLENVTKEHLLEVAKKLCIKNNMDYIIANDLHDLRQGTHLSFLVNKDGYQNEQFTSPEDIFVSTKQKIKSH